MNEESCSFEHLEGHRYARLTTYRKSGEPVPIPVWFRLPLAVAIVWWGARTDRRWTVPLASCMALPVLWFNGFAMLVAMLPLLARTASETPAGRWLQRTEPASPRVTA